MLEAIVLDANQSGEWVLFLWHMLGELGEFVGERGSTEWLTLHSLLQTDMGSRILSAWRSCRIVFSAA